MRAEPVATKSGSNFVYGMTSSAEDFADIGGAVTTADLYPKVRGKLRDVLVSRIRSGKLSLPVRFQLHLLANGFLDTEVDGPGDTLRKRLADAILANQDQLEEYV